MKTKLFFLVALLTTCLFSLSVNAAMFDPSQNWKTIKTEHFKVNFPGRIEPVAKRSAQVLEEIFPQVTEKWSFKPYGRTEVILTDETDDANGMASVLPYNWMLIYINPPDPDSSLGHYDDWLKTLLAHEFTHIVQIDAFGGSWWPLRVIMGKTVAPSGINPTWLREGMSQYGETIFTGGGRGRGTYSDMVVRTSILENAFPTIDLADGLSWRWPAYKTAYVFGLKFTQWLIETYGEEKFLQLDKNIRSSIMLAMVNHQARRVYKKTFYELWREWHASLQDKYSKVNSELSSYGLTPYEPLIPSKKDEQYFAPTPSPDGKYIAYSVTSPHRKDELRILNVETGKSSRIAKSKSTVQFSWSADGKKLIFATQKGYKRYYDYFDLYMCTFNDKMECAQKRLTKGKRARDPDLSPDGKYIIFVDSGMGTDNVHRMNVETKALEKLTGDQEMFTQFANPRYSPDGKYIVASVWKAGDGWKLYRFDENFRNPVKITSGKGMTIESRPSWTKDGKTILFSSDESGISNLYAVAALGRSSAPVRLTTVLTGAFMPFQLGNKVLALRYNAKGFEIVNYLVDVSNIVPAKSGKKNVTGVKNPKSVASDFTMELQVPSDKKITGTPLSLTGATSGGKKTLSVVEGDGNAASVDAKKSDLQSLDSFKSEKYVAFGQSLFRPRFLLPNLMYIDDFFYASVMTGGMDALRWHRWTADVNYRTDAKRVGYGFDYTYSRYRPVFGGGFKDFSVNFGEVLFQATSRQVHLFEHRRGFYVFAGVPLDLHFFSLAYYYEDHMPGVSLTPAEIASLNLGKFAGFRASYNYGDAEVLPAAISKENGRNIKLHTSWTNKKFGSGDRNEQVIFAGDWREYIRLGGHHVLALRAGGGMTWGDRLVQGTFGMGGAIGEGAFASGGSYTYFPFRGLPVSALSRTRALLVSGEYRFPIYALQRGIGTIPFFVKGISGAILSDFGNAWNAGENNDAQGSINTFFDDFLLSVGAELRGDFLIGHGLPLHGRIGYAVVVRNRDRVRALTDPILGSSVDNGMLILTLGTSF